MLITITWLSLVPRLSPFFTLFALPHKRSSTTLCITLEIKEGFAAGFDQQRFDAKQIGPLSNPFV